jgi:LysM repeat protein
MMVERMIRRKILFGVLLLGPIAFGKPQRGVQEAALGTVVADVAALRDEVNSLAVEVRHLQTDVNVLKLNVNGISEEQRGKIEKIAEEVVRKNDPTELVDHHVNVLSLAFSKEINGLSEKLQNVLNRVIAVLNAQQKIGNSIIGTFSKQPDGIAYEVRAGETLDGIAAKHKVTREAIKALNFIVNEDHLPSGQMLFIPKGHTPQGK